MRSQSGLQRRGLLFEGPRARGLLLRGVVMATYVSDDPNHPAVTETSDDGRDPVGVYCDVLVYSSLPGMHTFALPKVLVSQDRGAMHDGRVWKPRATRVDVSAATLDPDTGSMVGNLDGDHVLVGFIDDALNFPVILGGISHPSVDVGTEAQAAVGHRRALRVADGDPDFVRHHGSFFGVDTNGDWIADTTMANSGDLADDGSEPEAPTDGTGAQRQRLPKDAEHRLEFWDMGSAPPVLQSLRRLLQDLYELSLGGGETLSVTGADGAAKLTLGDGAKSALIAQAWETFFDGTFKTWITTHTHPTGVGPSGSPTEAPTFPAYSSAAATSSKLLFPDG